MTSPRRSRVGNRGGRNASSRRQTQATQQQDLTSEEESSDTGSVTRCVCGQQHHVGMMVQCDKCEVWQHCDCVGLEKDDIPDQYYCELCKPENHTIVKGHGRNKRVYNPHGGKDVTNKTMTTKKRTTMNSRETSVPLSDVISPRSTTSKSHSQDDPSEYTTGRTSKRRRKADDADDDHDAKPRRSTSPNNSRHPATGRRRETSKSTDDSTTSNSATRAKRSRSASPLAALSVAVEEHSYESADEASSSTGGGSGSNAKSKKRRRTDRTASSRRGSTSANDVKVKPDPADERESLADALFIKEELSDVERPLGGDDDDDINMDNVDDKIVLASPEQCKELASPTSAKANGSVLAPRSQPLRRTPSASRRNPTTNLGKSRENSLTAPRDSSHQGSSSRQQSRATTPQPSDLAGPSSTGDNGDRERSRCPSPPARVRYPSSRMSLGEMNKRAKQILEYISRMQVEIVNDKKEGVNVRASEEGAITKSSAGGADAEKMGLVMHVEASSKVEVSHHIAVAATPNILITAATTTTVVNSEPSQFESASSSNLPSSVVVASAASAASTTTTMTSDSHTIYPQPSLSSSSTASTISSATTTLTSDADLAPGSLTLSASITGNLTSLEMMARLARELINFQQRFGGHHDSRTTKASASPSGLATISTASTTTMAVVASSTSTLTPPPHHHNTRERGRSERERERSADRRDVVESLLLMSADLGAAFGSLRNAGSRHAEREGNAGTFVRRAEGSVRRTASVTVR